MPHLALTAIIVRDYDEAIAFYVNAMGFELREDTTLEAGKRWVVVAPPGSQESGILLARATTPEAEARIGDQTGGRVGFFLHTDDFARDHARLTAAGATFVRGPGYESYGTVAVFADLYGNLWDLIQPS